MVEQAGEAAGRSHRPGRSRRRPELGRGAGAAQSVGPGALPNRQI